MSPTIPEVKYAFLIFRQDSLKPQWIWTSLRACLIDVLAEGTATSASASLTDSDIADEPSEVQHVLACLIVVMITELA